MRSICIITSPDPDVSAASVRSRLYPLLLIIPQTPHNETELGTKALQWARRGSLWRGAQLPCSCLFPVLLEQLSTAKGPKTWATFPCTSLCKDNWFQLSLLTCAQQVLILPALTCPRVLAWTFLPQDTHTSQSVPFILPVLQAQRLQHTIELLQVKGSPAVL